MFKTYQKYEIGYIGCTYLHASAAWRIHL